MEQHLGTKKMILILLAGMGLLLSCNKQGFLDKKPSTDLVVPSTLEDFQALLDNDAVIQETPVLGELSADNFYLNDAGIPYVTSAKERNAYVWANDIYEGQGNVDDWNLPYQQVFYANVVLEGLPGVAIDSSSVSTWKALQGAAYFIRAYAFYNLAQVFANVYGPSTVNDPGIPLRLSSDIKAVSVRGTVGNTYTQILSDLRLASSLLPAEPPGNLLNRPSKPAALAMLARVYLSMRDYMHAGIYADSCLKMNSALIDYNAVPRYKTFYFQLTKNDSETLYQSHLLSSSTALGAFIYPCIVDSNLYQSYADSDLRKYIFFIPFGYPTVYIRPNTNYSASVYLFSGLATDEVYLIRAECAAKLGNISGAINDLDALRQKRWAPGTYSSYAVTTQPGDVLDTVRAERRKELVYRGLRWTDLRRLNADGANITLTRMLNGMSYTLAPNDQRYLLPIPPDVITLSGIKQNPRP